MNVGTLSISDAITPELVVALATIGKVRVFSTQVVIESERGGIDFKQIVLPPHCSLEYACVRAGGSGTEAQVSITLKFEEKAVAA